MFFAILFRFISGFGFYKKICRLHFAGGKPNCGYSMVTLLLEVSFL